MTKKKKLSISKVSLVNNTMSKELTFFKFLIMNSKFLIINIHTYTNRINSLPSKPMRVKIAYHFIISRDLNMPSPADEGTDV